MLCSFIDFWAYYWCLLAADVRTASLSSSSTTTTTTQSSSPRVVVKYDTRMVSLVFGIEHDVILVMMCLLPVLQLHYYKPNVNAMQWLKDSYPQQ